MKNSITFFGHASFLILINNKAVYIDPYILPKNPMKADLILVTHEHYDHCATENINKIKRTDTTIIAPQVCKGKLSNAKIININESIDISGIKIKAVHAYNLNKSFHPKNRGVGYIITFDNKKIYHAGDTDFIPEMKKLESEGITYALLPIGGTYTMDLDEAVEAAISIKPSYVIPMHYNSLPELKTNPSEFKEKIEYRNREIKVLILRENESINID
jgi:L-ascorbate metabolism protein UlaG (beta-lactamase superfamily)